MSKKELFIKALAKFMAGNAAAKSIAAQVEGKTSPHPLKPSWAKEWSEVRNAGPMLGWASVEETEEKLRKFLGAE